MARSRRRLLSILDRVRGRGDELLPPLPRRRPKNLRWCTHGHIPDHCWHPECEFYRAGAP